MDGEEIRLECIKIAQDAKKDIGGIACYLTTKEVVRRAKEYFKFITED